LTIAFTDTGFGPFSGYLESDFGGVVSSGATLAYNVWVDYSNNPFGLGANVISFGPFGTGAFSDSSFGFVSTAGLFSVTQEFILTKTTGAASIGFGAEVAPVPEPGAFLLLGSGITALALLRRRRS
jgi:hypothetical protein